MDKVKQDGSRRSRLAKQGGYGRDGDKDMGDGDKDTVDVEDTVDGSWRNLK